MGMSVRHGILTNALVGASFVFFCSAALGQSITSTAYESYLNDSNLVDATGNPVNIYPVGFNVNTLASVQVQYPVGFAQPDYVTGADNEISILSLGTIYQPSFAGEVGAPFNAGPFEAYAYGDYGELHAYASVSTSNDGYFQAVSSSGSSIQTPTYEQFVFDVSGTITGDGAAILQVSAEDSPPAPNVFGGVSTSAGNLTAYDDHYSQTFGGPSEDDSFQFSGSGDAVATTQAYSISNGQVTPTVTLTANSNYEVSGQPVGSAEFGDTVTLDGILVYDQNGNLIPNSDLKFSDTSGATYSFMQGSTPAPEMSTTLSMTLAISILLALCTKGFRLSSIRQNIIERW
jgi:hypothetical protein